jgi:hypothetical protein
MIDQNISEFNARWPVFRTTKRADTRTMWHAALLGALGACLVPLGVGLLLLGLSLLFETTQSSEIYMLLWGFGFVLTMSPFLSVIAFIPACILSFTAMKFGCAGWMTAIGAGAAVATVIYSNLSIQGDPIVAGRITGGAFGAVFLAVGASVYAPRLSGTFTL